MLILIGTTSLLVIHFVWTILGSNQWPPQCQCGALPLSQSSSVSELYNSQLTGVIILNTLNIILTKVATCLNFDEYELLCTSISNAMKNSGLDINCFSSDLFKHLSIQSNCGDSGNNEPVLLSLLMALIRETSPGSYIYAFNFMCWSVLQNLVTSPWSEWVVINHYVILSLSETSVVWYGNSLSLKVEVGTGFEPV